MFAPNPSAEEMLDLQYGVAARVRPVGDSRTEFALDGLFFPLDMDANDWAMDSGFEELEGATLVEPHDSLPTELFSQWPFQPDGLGFWADEEGDRFLVTLDVNSREYAMVRQMAQIARARGMQDLINE